MFHVTAQEAQTTKNLRGLLATFDGDAEVWRGAAGDLLIGDTSDLDEDDAATYTMAGTVAEYLADMTDDA